MRVIHDEGNAEIDAPPDRFLIVFDDVCVFFCNLRRERGRGHIAAVEMEFPETGDIRMLLRRSGV